jgi:hypothetical protein
MSEAVKSINETVSAVENVVIIGGVGLVVYLFWDQFKALFGIVGEELPKVLDETKEVLDVAIDETNILLDLPQAAEDISGTGTAVIGAMAGNTGALMELTMKQNEWRNSDNDFFKFAVPISDSIVKAIDPKGFEKQQEANRILDKFTADRPILLKYIEKYYDSDLFDVEAKIILPAVERAKERDTSYFNALMSVIGEYNDKYKADIRFRLGYANNVGLVKDSHGELIGAIEIRNEDEKRWEQLNHFTDWVGFNAVFMALDTSGEYRTDWIGLDMAQATSRDEYYDKKQRLREIVEDTVNKGEYPTTFFKDSPVIQLGELDFLIRRRLQPNTEPPDMESKYNRNKLRLVGAYEWFA